MFSGPRFLGLAAGDNSTLFNLIVVNTEDNFLHLAIAALGILAGALSPPPESATAEPGLVS